MSVTEFFDFYFFDFLFIFLIFLKNKKICHVSSCRRATWQ